MPKAKSVGSAEVQALRDRILPYQEIPRATRVVSKLLASNRALRALAEMQLDDRQLSRVLLSAVDAVENEATFEGRIAKETIMPGRMARLGAAVSELRKFVMEVAAPPTDQLAAQIIIEPEERAKYLSVLYEIGRLIGLRKMIALETAPRVGATRKHQTRNAAQNAGIGWLAVSIKRITGRPYLRQACILAEVLFSPKKKLSEDRLRKALRNFSERSWRSHG